MKRADPPTKQAIQNGGSGRFGCPRVKLPTWSNTESFPRNLEHRAGSSRDQPNGKKIIDSFQCPTKWGRYVSSPENRVWLYVVVSIVCNCSPQSLRKWFPIWRRRIFFPDDGVVEKKHQLGLHKTGWCVSWQAKKQLTLNDEANGVSSTWVSLSLWVGGLGVSYNPIWTPNPPTQTNN